LQLTSIYISRASAIPVPEQTLGKAGTWPVQIEDSEISSGNNCAKSMDYCMAA
jgi:hypothetical protein